MSTVSITKPLGRVIISDFTASGYLLSRYTPALVMFSTKGSTFAITQFQAFADTRTIQCFVGFPLDGVLDAERELSEILTQAIGKLDIKFPTYILYNLNGKIVYDGDVMTAKELLQFVTDNYF